MIEETKEEILKDNYVHQNGNILEQQEIILQRKVFEVNNVAVMLQEIEDTDFYSEPLDKKYFLISTNWLNTWKKVVNYDLTRELILEINPQEEKIKSLSPDQFRKIQKKLQQCLQQEKNQQNQNQETQQVSEKISKSKNFEPNFEHLKKIKLNSDLIDPEIKDSLLKFNDKNSAENIPLEHWNIILKEDIAENEDYIVADQQLFSFFYERYQGIPVIRYAYKPENEPKQLEVHLFKINLFIATISMLKDIDNRKKKQFLNGYINVSQYLTVKQLQDILNENVLQYNDINISAKPDKNVVRLWLLNEKYTDLKTYFQEIQKAVNDSKNYNYKIQIDGELLNYGKEAKMKLIQDVPIIYDSLVLLEIKEDFKQWVFYNDKVPKEDNCEFCNQTKILSCVCSCKKVAYCSQECLEKDQQYHFSRCTRSAEEEISKSKQLSLNEQSRHGYTGLKNLGNTCFMNSGLQCLQNCHYLTQYFLKNIYENHINRSNLLGTNGQLVQAYASLLQNLHLGNQSYVTPFIFKQALGQFQPIFKGYNQQDSQEMVNFLLDGLHEDLNLIKKKPFREQKDEDGPKQYWENFIARNQSIIQYLIYGQYKSVIKCPDCPKVSITYDPFSMISLPIPENTLSDISVLIIQGIKEKEIKIQFDSLKKETLFELKEKIELKENIKPDNIVFYTMGVYSYQKLPNSSLLNLLNNNSYSKLQALVLDDFEASIPKENLIQVEVQHKREQLIYGNKEFRNFRKKIAFLDLQQSLKSIHLKFFKLYLPLIDINEEVNEENLEQYYEKYMLQQNEKNKETTSHTQNGEQQQLEQNGKENQQLKMDQEQKNETENKIENQNIIQDQNSVNKLPPYQLFLETNAKSYLECYFCGQKDCKQCALQYDDNITLQDIKNKIQKDYFKIKFQIHWNFVKPELDKKNEQDIFSVYQQIQKENQNQNGNQMEIEVNGDQQNNKLEKEDQNQNGTQQITKNKLQINNFPNKGYYSIYDAFAKFQEKEILGKDNEWYCNKCKQHKQAQKQVFIYKTPRILILHLKRFKKGSTHSNHKIKSVIDFPIQGLQLKDFVIDKNLPGNDYQPQEIPDIQFDQEQPFKDYFTYQDTENGIIYDLFAVSNHYGSINYGHYTAYAKNEQKQQWLEYDDENVKKVTDMSDLVSEAAYILFYKRRDCEPFDDVISQLIAQNQQLNQEQNQQKLQQQKQDQQQTNSNLSTQIQTQIQTQTQIQQNEQKEQNLNINQNGSGNIVNEENKESYTATSQSSDGKNNTNQIFQENQNDQQFEEEEGEKQEEQEEVKSSQNQ